MKIAFFGTSNRSVPLLNSIKNTGLNFCVTKESSEVKLWAINNHINYLTIKNLATETDKVAKKLSDLNIDLGVVADFSFKIPEKIINIPTYKLINVHFSLLPKLRGASPVQHAILQGLDETGITFYIMNKGMDTGDILHQIKYPLNNMETSKELWSVLFNKAAEELPKVIENYTRGSLIPYEQNHEKATCCYSKTHPKSTLVYKEDGLIDWSDLPEYIERQVRAFSPWPSAWTYLRELPVTLKSHVNPKLKIKILETKMKNDKLEIIKVQVEGKKATDWKSFKNGYAKKQ